MLLSEICADALPDAVKASAAAIVGEKNGSLKVQKAHWYPLVRPLCSRQAHSV